MVCGPEIVRCVKEFESSLPIYQKDNQKHHKHHEQTENKQGRFSIHLSNLIQVISEFGNPFLETSTDLLDGLCTVNSTEDLGKKQFNDFVQNRLNTQVYSLYDPIKKKKLLLFSKASVKNISPKSRNYNTEKELSTILSTRCCLSNQEWKLR